MAQRLSFSGAEVVEPMSSFCLAGVTEDVLWITFLSTLLLSSLGALSVGRHGVGVVQVSALPWDSAVSFDLLAFTATCGAYLCLHSVTTGGAREPTPQRNTLPDGPARLTRNSFPSPLVRSMFSPRTLCQSRRLPPDGAEYILGIALGSVPLLVGSRHICQWVQGVC
jgi:hypothetical protein